MATNALETERIVDPHRQEYSQCAQSETTEDVLLVWKGENVRITLSIVRLGKASGKWKAEALDKVHHLAKEDLQDYCICFGSVAEEVVSNQVDVAGRIPVERT
jgi:hypothetical protein